MWKADKLIYNGDDSYVMAYQGNELVWYKADPIKYIIQVQIIQLLSQIRFICQVI